MVGEPAASDHQPVNDNQSQQLKVPKLNDNHSHAASKNLPTTNYRQCTINFSNQDWQIDKNLFVYFFQNAGYNLITVEQNMKGG